MELHLKQTDSGIWYRPDKGDLDTIGEIFNSNEYAYVKKLDLGNNPVVYDLGSHIGCFSRYINDLIPNSHIIAIDPNHENNLVYSLNMYYFKGFYTLYDGFISGREGFGQLLTDGNPYSFRKRQYDALNEGIPCYTMEIFTKWPFPSKVDLLKCDIEGTETELFGDCSKWIDKVKYAIIETHRCYYGNGFDLPMLYDALDKQKVQYKKLHESKGCIAYLQFN